MNFNFFDWIREGVKQSVLMGVADAAEQIAPRAEAEAIQQHFLSSVREGALIGHTPKTGRSSKRKSLGRSLSQIVDPDDAAK